LHGAIAAKVTEENKGMRPLILKKSSKEKKEKCMLKEELQIPLD
jgi:hypothetical protein